MKKLTPENEGSGDRLQLAGHIQRMCEESDKKSMEDRRVW